MNLACHTTKKSSISLKLWKCSWSHLVCRKNKKVNWNCLTNVSTGQQNETLCKNYISEIKDLRLRIEDCEAGTVARIRRPVEKEPLKECIQKTTEQKVLY